MAPTGSWTRLSSTRLMTRPIKSTTLKPMMKKLTMAQTTAMTRADEMRMAQTLATTRLVEFLIR